MKKKCFLLIFILGMGCESRDQIPADKKREFANSLFNRELYQQSIEEYKDYLDHYPLSADQQASVNYTIAEIYFDRLKDYHNALAYYLKVQSFYPQASVIPDVNKKVVACLERLDMTSDAQRQLEQATAFDPSQVQKSEPGEIIAKIGNRVITTGDLEAHIKELPPAVQGQIQTKEKKIAFLHDYILSDLLYDTAKRKGYDQDKVILARAFEAKKSMMAQKILEEEILNSVKVDMVDVVNYYKANKDRYTEKNQSGKVVKQKEFSEVQQQVLQDLSREKQQAAYNALFQRLIQAEKVEMFESKIR